MKHARTRGCDLQVRLKAAIRIDLRRRKRQDLRLDNRTRRSFENRQEERDVTARVIDLRISWNDEKDGAFGESLRAGRNGQRAYRGSRAADALEGGLQPRFPKNASQQRP